MTLTKPRLLGIVVSLMVVIAVVAGLFVAGSPLKERQRKLDAERINNLMQIASGMDSYYQTKRALPASLEQLRSEPQSSYVQAIKDPKTGAPYEYHTLTETSYEVCASFELSSDEASADPSIARPVYAPVPYGAMKTPASSEPSFWNHPTGRKCFTLDERDRLPELSSKDGSNCTLMRERATGKLDCFGCAGGICKDPAPNFEPYALPPGAIGIPYSCFASEQGCSLAQ